MATGLEEALLLVNVVLLAAAVPVTLIAYVGFRGTPWGKVIKWFPLVAVGYLLTQSLILLDYGTSLSFALGVAGLVVGVTATTVNSVRLAVLLTERRQV